MGIVIKADAEEVKFLKQTLQLISEIDSVLELISGDINYDCSLGEEKFLLKRTKSWLTFDFYEVEGFIPTMLLSVDELANYKNLKKTEKYKLLFKYCCRFIDQVENLHKKANSNIELPFKIYFSDSLGQAFDCLVKVYYLLDKSIRKFE